MHASKFLLSILLSISAAISQEIGQIAYFDKKCPEGWVEFIYSSGRVIVSQGSGIDSLGNTRNFTLGGIGGEYSHVMNITEMAAHQHKTGLQAWGNTYGGGIFTEPNGVLKGTRPNYNDTNTSTVGGGAPFNIMQPYLVLVACKCLENVAQSDLLKQISSLQEQFKRIQSDVQDEKLDILKMKDDMKEDKCSHQSDLDKVQASLNSDQAPYNATSVISLVLVCISLGAFVSYKFWICMANNVGMQSSYSEPSGNANSKQKQQKSIMTVEIKV